MEKYIIKIKKIAASSSVTKRILITAAGALAGYAYYYFIGCSSGSCPITGSPYMSTIYGAFAGFVISGGGCGNSCSTR